MGKQTRKSTKARPSGRSHDNPPETYNSCNCNENFCDKTELKQNIKLNKGVPNQCQPLSSSESEDLSSNAEKNKVSLPEKMVYSVFSKDAKKFKTGTMKMDRKVKYSLVQGKSHDGMSSKIETKYSSFAEGVYYLCDVCSRKFVTINSLYSHKLTQHHEFSINNPTSYKTVFQLMSRADGSDQVNNEQNQFLLLKKAQQNVLQLMSRNFEDGVSMECDEKVAKDVNDNQVDENESKTPEKERHCVLEKKTKSRKGLRARC